jgi:hypothetical protein
VGPAYEKASGQNGSWVYRHTLLSSVVRTGRKSNTECADAKLRERAIAHNGVSMTKARVTEEPGDRETITPGSVVAVRGATPSPTITQADAAAAAGNRARNWLCNAARIEAHFGKPAARLTRRALGTELIG